MNNLSKTILAFFYAIIHFVATLFLASIGISIAYYWMAKDNGYERFTWLASISMYIISLFLLGASYTQLEFLYIPYSKLFDGNKSALYAASISFSICHLVLLAALWFLIPISLTWYGVLLKIILVFAPFVALCIFGIYLMKNIYDEII